MHKVASVTALAVALSALAAPAVPLSLQLTQTQWVAQSLARMQTIRVGMTRMQLLRVFEPGNGLFSREQQSYEYRACPYFSVRVRFHPVGRDMGNQGNPRDRITAISQPVVEQGSFYAIFPSKPVPVGSGRLRKGHSQ